MNDTAHAADPTTDATPDLSTTTLVVVGAGTMGGAFATAALAAGVTAQNLRVVNSSDESSRRAADRLGATAGSIEDVAHADVVVIGVKPYQQRATLPPLIEHLRPETVVISLAAGATLQSLTRDLGGHERLVRAMPNTPMAVGEGVTALMFTDAVPEEQRALTRDLLHASGIVEEISEGSVHAVIGAAGSAPAFVFYLMEAMIDEAVRQGLTRAVATRMVEQTVKGAAQLVIESGDHPAIARAGVSSPGGTTAEGVAALDRHGMRAGIAAAMEAAAAKSRAMSGE